MQESILQQNRDSRPMAVVLFKAGIIPGIKVDTGAKQMTGLANEKIAEGLDGLRERLQGYNSMDACFVKWGSLSTIVDNTPLKNLYKPMYMHLHFFKIINSLKKYKNEYANRVIKRRSKLLAG